MSNPETITGSLARDLRQYPRELLNAAAEHAAEWAPDERTLDDIRAEILAGLDRVLPE